MQADSNNQVRFGLHTKQITAFTTPATEVLYGGAAGGGKSHLMRLAAITWCLEIPGIQIYLFRRIFADLIKNHVEGPTGFRNLLQAWVAAKDVEIVEDEIRFKNGSKIFLCHCFLDRDRFKYQGSEIHVLLIDELTLFTDKIYRFLRNRLRMVNVPMPDKYKGMFPRILCGSNPGNVGHVWVKQTFIDPMPPLEIYRTEPSEGGMMRQFIPARLDDNPSLHENDPTYGDRLAGLGSEALVKAMRDGNWDVIEGAFFDKWRAEKHTVTPFEIPDHWTRFVSLDWGYAKPFSCHWWAIADGNFGPYPRDSIICYREWYGCKDDEADKGLRMEAEDFRDGFMIKNGEDKLTYIVCDPAMWGTQSGPSVAETLYNEGKGMKNLRKAVNRRISVDGSAGGWDQMRARIKGVECSDKVVRPMLYYFNTCSHAIRTIPALQHDEDRPEDLNTHMEDHAADDCRYACMSRPMILKSHKNTPTKPPAGHSENGRLTLPAVGDNIGLNVNKDLDR